MTDQRLLDLAADIAVSYVANNPLPAAELPGLVPALYARLATLGAPAAAPDDLEPDVEKPTAAAIKKSITPDGLISFIDGGTYQTLKRHLGTHGLTPEGYRQRYGLAPDYPMTAPGYSARRSALAKEIGLGQRGDVAAQAAE